MLFPMRQEFPNYETGVFIQLTLIDAALYPGEDTDRMSMAVSQTAVIERNAKKVAFFNLQATLDQQTKKRLFTGICYFASRPLEVLPSVIKPLNGQEA